MQDIKTCERFTAAPITKLSSAPPGSFLRAQMKCIMRQVCESVLLSAAVSTRSVVFLVRLVSLYRETFRAATRLLVRGQGCASGCLSSP